MSVNESPNTAETDAGERDVYMDAVSAITAIGPVRADALTNLDLALALPPGTLTHAAWDLVDDGALTYGANAYFTRVTSPEMKESEND